MPRSAHASSPSDNRSSFLQQLEEVVEANLQNDQFSVEALAEQMNMSRSNLHRKLKQGSGKTANQFIREYRLELAMKLLKKEGKTITEVAYEVGFSSQSYFTSCFTEYYGYPPGEAKFRANEASPTNELKPTERSQFRLPIRALALVGLLAIGLTFVVFLGQWQAAGPEAVRDQLVAVLPLKNLNVDQEYEYFSEGVVQAINRHLSQIEGLKVISLTSTDRYRETDLSAQQIGKELKVANLLEGSIQRQADDVRIEIRLVDTQTGQQIWAESYDRKWKDLLEIQGDIAQQVAQRLQSKLPKEQEDAPMQQQAVNPEATDLKENFEARSNSRKSNLEAIQFTPIVVADSLYSASLENNGGENPTRTMLVYLPPGYEENTNKRYPVIYYLHGFTSSDSTNLEWFETDKKLEFSYKENKIRPFILVVANQHTLYKGSFYTNSSLTGNWADFTAKDLVSYIDSKYRTIPHRDSRGVCGWSMGGSGSIKMGMLYPDVFSCAYAIAPAILTLCCDWGATNPGF